MRESVVMWLSVACAVGCGVPLDRRVEPTINPHVPKYASPAERIKLIEAANATRNEVLAKFPPPVAVCTRVADGAIQVDGKLDDPAWKSLPSITGFRNSRTGVAEKHPTSVKLAWDAHYLYAAFDCADSDVQALIAEHDGELWRHDAAELFIDANADEMSYLEFEVAPNGAFYDASVAEYRPEVTWDASSPHLDIAKSIKIYRVKHSKWAARVRGTMNDSSDTDQSWTCEMAISWADIRSGTNVSPGGLPPRDGDVWRMGIYRINVKSKDGAEDEYAAWNPTGTWFHRPYCFGRVVFVK